ncbi:MAG TPA: ATP-binding cassette domain-containing protein [Euzebyales bacterium]|nr:ATP-binding cassette domain-containing protein [Euzebyales bacterium]
MAHVDVSHLRYVLPNGRVLLDDVSFRVGEGAKAALIGANGTGKTTLLRILAGELTANGGTAVSSGGLGVMPQFIGSITDGSDVRDLLLSVAPTPVRTAAAALDRAELAMMDNDDERTQLAYAEALARWTDVGGYDAEHGWDACCTAALRQHYERVRYRAVVTLSGGEQKRLVLEALLRGPDGMLLLDEPDNYLDQRSDPIIGLTSGFAGHKQHTCIACRTRSRYRRCSTPTTSAPSSTRGYCGWPPNARLTRPAPSTGWVSNSSSTGATPRA